MNLKLNYVVIEQKDNLITSLDKNKKVWNDLYSTYQAYKNEFNML